MRYLLGFILVGFGFICIWKTESFLRGLGRSAWAEDKFGPGGTRTLYKIIGLSSILMGFLIMFGFVFAILDWIFPF